METPPLPIDLKLREPGGVKIGDPILRAVTQWLQGFDATRLKNRFTPFLKPLWKKGFREKVG
jgi:hypothetical protein